MQESKIGGQFSVLLSVMSDGIYPCQGVTPQTYKPASRAIEKQALPENCLILTRKCPKNMKAPKA
jgi:hypothetical protein